MQRTKIIFRADGNSRIGLGHVVRSLALAELLHDDFDCTFAIQEPSQTLLTQLNSVCEEVICLPSNQSEALFAEAQNIAEALTGQEIIVLDGYHFTTEYQQILKRKGNVLVCLDDLHDRKFMADAIINIAGGVKPEMYQATAYTRFCIGPEYALLRKPFRDAQKTVGKTPAKVAKILICFGGADPENYTLNFARKLHQLNPHLHLEIVTGSAYQHTELLKDFLAEKRGANWHQNLNAEEMCALMKNCEAALCSASSVAYEYCAVNGMLFIEKTAGNQTDLYNFLIAENLALPAEKLPALLSEKTVAFQDQKLIEKQRKIFNGQAEENLRRLFRQLALQARLFFRQATLEDATLLFDWANDPEVRRFSFNSEPIPFETHLNWLNGKLKNPDALLLIAEINTQPAALLRFDVEGNSALISYQIGAAYRGKGLGHRVLQLGLPVLKKHFAHVSQAIGYVQPVNVPSVRAFEKAEYKNLGMEEKNLAYKFLIEI
ncbi:UDP-2,4-diacetamido-2,4,6-trideoxy-beta-L-altropyranose hydrolase [Adhaeribacter sp. BT258]|uniref:UDP-2,4-diacetamido-2,4, 6-trideoxy-beta-L-altropyranose hydrolase n=1 Tax=Adhaeribacter terrigena TaxID=2793070 RepID=A0ABS1C2Z8_9BACT|nr:UDP-2,4-diacetamido-2,4,6-trideoxy-beta-L-altropyranose hydrolase [Adhaeribacter terrigena]MBK0403779.1 UDP-2,4-diacetamido-2,4,6-trideoxy-beta-L-altropyranose hydrolase [Adhaeribacter terrigena]